MKSLWIIRIANSDPQNDSNQTPKASAINICSVRKQNYQSLKPLNWDQGVLGCTVNWKMTSDV